MVLIILSFVILFICIKYIVDEWQNNNGFITFVFISFFYVLIAFIIWVAIGFTMIAIEYTQKSIGNKIYSESIYSISKYSGFQGRFTLGCGIINDKQYFLYYEKKTDGSFMLKKTESEGLKIIESGSKPSYNYENKVVKCRWWLSFPGKNQYLQEDKQINRVLIIPVGSIIQEYKMN